MKARSIITALVMLVSAVAVAGSPEPRIKIYSQLRPGTFKIVYLGQNTGDVTLSIYNEAGETVFSNVTYQVSSFVQPVNFESMLTGEYTVEITDATGTAAQKIVYSRARALKNAHVSKLPQDGKYLLAVPNDGTREITVNIFDGNKNLVHSEDRTIQGSFGLVYALQNVSGVPTFEIMEKNGVIYPLEY